MMSVVAMTFTNTKPIMEVNKGVVRVWLGIIATHIGSFKARQLLCDVSTQKKQKKCDWIDNVQELYVTWLFKVMFG